MHATHTGRRPRSLLRRGSGLPNIVEHHEHLRNLRCLEHPLYAARTEIRERRLRLESELLVGKESRIRVNQGH
jgi:hypothetical protein